MGAVSYKCRGWGEHGVWVGGDHVKLLPCIWEQQGVSDHRGTAQSTNMGCEAKLKSWGKLIVCKRKVKGDKLIGEGEEV